MSKEKLKNWEQHPSQPYFVFNPHGDGFCYFATEKERDDFASDAIQDYLEDCWDEEVTNVVAGKLTHTTVQTDREERPDDLDEDGIDSSGDSWADEWEYKCNYKLKPLEKTLRNSTKEKKLCL